jgi:hypothetical protein
MYYCSRLALQLCSLQRVGTCDWVTGLVQEVLLVRAQG